jgi:diguanylate cyclase (GGDEF)-like protein/PAS domain S-box-containing protein
MNGNELRRWLRALAQPTTYLGVAMLLSIVAGVAYLLVQSRAVEVEEAKRSGDNIVRIFAQSISRLLTNADNTLLLLRKFYEDHPYETEFVQWTAAFKNDLRLQYSLIGPDGIIRASSYGPAAVGLDVSQLEHFKVQATATEDRLFVSKPVNIRSIDKLGIILTRRLTAPNGSFAGVITASFDPSQVQRLFQRVELGDGSGLSLMDFDGVLFANISNDPSKPSLVGQRFPNAGVLKQVAQARAGVYWNTPGTLDGVKRLISYRVVDGFPLIAVVGISEAAVFLQWRKITRVYLAVGGLLMCATLIAIALGAMREKRLITAKSDLERLNLWFDTALDTMSQGLTMYDRSDRLLLVNNRYREMYGMSADQVRPGDTIQEIFARRSEGLSPQQIDDYLVPSLRELHAGRALDKLAERDGKFYAVSLRPVKSGGWVSTHQDVTEQTRAEREVLHLAHYDALTELTSRGLFQTYVDRAVVRLRHHGERFNILLLDLDRFKAINDSLGHLAGDRLLRQVASRLKSCVHQCDVVARLGGDEFAVLQAVNGDPRECAVALAARLLDIIGEPYDLDGHRAVVETSIGIVLAPEHGEHAEQLIKNADLALYEAKAEGRNAWRLFEVVMGEQARARYELELDLRNAIERGEFELYYQPVVDTATREVRGLEALIRWNHPSHGIIAPREFIPIAESTGLIVPLGESILRQGCADAASWPDNFTLAVNLSPVQFGKGNIVETVARVLSQTGLAAERLELEITESVLLRADEPNVSKLHQLKALGVSIVLDDFGTGYSSLSYLRMFPFDKIKIDRSFVVEIATRSDCAAIVTAIIGLARCLDMVTTAEGVETVEQFELLRIAGCGQVQGYLFGRPAPISQLRLDRGPIEQNARVA